jgi:spermidine synthase
MKTSKASSGVAESPLILSCFFLSGVAGLIYEVLWVRLIDKVMGSAPFAVATVLSVFMGGLALGSYLAGSRTA